MSYGDPFIDAVDDWCSRDDRQFADRNAAWLFFFKAGQVSVASHNVIGQPQEDVCCEWVECREANYYIHVSTCKNRIQNVIPKSFKFCPYCGKPIKVKE